MKHLSKVNILTLGFILIILVMAVAATVYFLNKHPVPEDAPLNKALSAVEGTEGFTDINGNKVNLTDHFGKILVVTSWASWCPQCAGDLPQLAGLSNEYADKGVVVLAINRAENRYTAERFLSSIESTDGLTIILDSADHFFVAHEGYAMPETILYDQKGAVALHQRGILRIDELKNVLRELLNN
jgi:thiol-disulfide isomerase/thioredoxin